MKIATVQILKDCYTPLKTIYILYFLYFLKKKIKQKNKKQKQNKQTSTTRQPQMTSKEVTEKQEEIRGIIRELDSHDSESLPINEAFNELGKIQLAYYSRIKELYADLYSDGLIASLLPQPQTLNFKDTFKDRLNSLIKEKPMFSSKYKEYITKCNQHIEAYKKLKASMHIQSNVNYNDLFKALYPTLYDSHTFGERGSSSSSNKQQQCGLPAKRSEVDDDDDDNEKPIDNEKPVDMSGSPGQFASGDAANEVPIGGSADDEIPITQNENDRQQMSRYTDSEVPINSNDDETPMDNTHKEEEERKRKEEEERKRKEEEERKRKEEEERKRKEEEERRKRKEEEERKRKEEEEKKRALFENKFLLLFNIEKGKKFDDPRDIRKVLFANGFLFSRDVFQSVFPCKEEKDIEAMYPNALISNDTKQLRIYEYPAQDQQAYPEGILSINIFNGIETKRDVLCVVDPAHKEVTDWLANHKDHIKPADNVYYHKKNFTKAGAQEELKSLRSSETNFPLWYTFYTKYGSSYLIVATTNSKCNDFQSIQAKDVTDIIKNGCKLEFDLCTGIDKPSCKNGNSCPLFLDKAHMEKYMHPHGENVCPDILTCKGSERNLTHICSKGTKCTRANNKEHCKTNIHLRVCDTYSCKEDSLAHRVGGHPGSVTKQELAKTEKLSLCSCENMHTSTGWTEAIVPNFDLNVAAWIKACKLYVKDDIETSNREFNKIASWFAGLLPVHLCPGSGLVGVTKMGAIISLDTLINVWKTPDVKFVLLSAIFFCLT